MVEMFGEGFIAGTVGVKAARLYSGKSGGDGREDKQGSGRP